MLWLTIAPHIAKSTRYTLGARIENLFLDLLEKTYTAYFIPRERKEEKLRSIEVCIRLLDILKYFVSIAWEGDVISGQQFEAVAQKLEEAGRRLYAWKESLNNPDKKNRSDL